MGTYLLDTNAFSALVERHARVVARAGALGPGDRMVVCTIVRGEILYGLAHMPHGKRRRQLEARTAKLFARIPCVGLSEPAADAYARVKRDCEQKGTPLDENDLWIGAAALERGAVLVSSDTDFQKVSGLRIEDWTQ